MTQASDATFRTSATSLATYRDCPKRWKEQTRQTSVASEKGSIFHEAMQKIHRCEMTPLQARKWGSDEIVNSGMSAEDLKDFQEWINKITSIAYFMPKPEDIIAVESDDGEIMLHGSPAFEVPLPLVVQGKRVTMSGKMDLVLAWKEKNGILIRDYKTGFMDADEFQADYYALAAYLKYWKTAPIGVQFVYPRRAFSPRPTHYSEADMPRVLEYVSILAAKLASDKEFKPRLNSGCKYCSLKMGCEAFLDATAKAPKIPEIDPENWGAIRKWREHLSTIVSATNGLLDQVKGLEKAYLKKHKTAIDPDGSEAFYAQQVGGYNYPTDKMIALFSKYNLPWTGVVKMSSEAINDAIQSAVVNGKITETQATEIEVAIKGKVRKVRGQEIVEVEPIRTVAYHKDVIKTRKPAADNAEE